MNLKIFIWGQSLKLYLILGTQRIVIKAVVEFFCTGE